MVMGTLLLPALVRRAGSSLSGLGVASRAAAASRRSFAQTSCLSQQQQAETSGHQQTAASWEVNVRSSDPEYLRGARDSSWWTGKAPTECAGFQPEEQTLSSLPLPNLRECTREQLLSYFENTWAKTDVLFAGLQSEEAFYRPPYHDLRHPKIFYYAHTAAVYINKLRVSGLLEQPVNEYYEHIFETGVDEMSWDDLSKNHMVWPSVAELTDYRREVFNRVANTIMEHPAFETIGELEASPFWAVVLGTEHEHIHLETSSVLMRELPLDLVRHPEYFPRLHPSAADGVEPGTAPERGTHFPDNAMVGVKGGSVTLGKPRDFPSFGWDNEYGTKTMHVRPFETSKFMISNGEFFDFVKSGGYSMEHYWTAEGWQWRAFRNVKWPTYWVPTGPTGLHQYRLRTIFEEIDMPWAWPAAVNYHEAKAYANWRSEQEGVKYRIGTEAEHQLLCHPNTRDPALGVARDPVMTMGGAEFRAAGVNLNLAHGSESPVDAGPANPVGVHDSMGNVWEWNEDHFNAFPGFKIHQFYEDFSLPCFDGKHNLILGGSFISCGQEASIFARYHFRPHFFQHAGFRLVKPDAAETLVPTSCTDNPGPYVGTYPFRRSSDTVDAATGAIVSSEAHKYDEQKMLQQYIYLHYGHDEPAGVPVEATRFPSRCAQLVAEAAEAHGVQTGRVLDVGCGTGGIAFQLARYFDQVEAIDLSENFIQTAQNIQRQGSIPSTILDEGEIYHNFEATVPAGIDAKRVSFKVGDAMCLPPDIGTFDAVLLANVIDRLPVPSSCLGRMGGSRGVVAPNGLLFVISPSSWNQAFTPKELWLGGYNNSEGKRVTSLDGLHQVLDPHFNLLSQQDMPFVLREHARKYEYIVANVSVWQNQA
jgi:5-histidylcysteine sulfoxide synthase/putative 4-mercaptohistidine N1-methyltranferase